MPRFVCMILLLLTTALAQDASTGAIRGSVFDSTGRRIQGASVALVNTATGLRYGITTDSEGRFTFDLLPPGTSELEFRLAVAGTKEIVTVSGEQPLVETQPSAVSSLIDERAINELPLNGCRYTDLALLTPGVTQDPRGLTSGSNGDLAFGGIRATNRATLSTAAITIMLSFRKRAAGKRAIPVLE